MICLHFEQVQKKREWVPKPIIWYENEPPAKGDAIRLEPSATAPFGLVGVVTARRWIAGGSVVLVGDWKPINPPVVSSEAPAVEQPS